MTDTLINGISLERRKYATTFAGQISYDLGLKIKNIKDEINDPKNSNSFTRISNLENELNELETQNGAMAFTVVSNVFEMAGQEKTTGNGNKKININGLFERFKGILEKGIEDKDFKNSEEYRNFLNYLRSTDEFKDLTVSYGDKLEKFVDFFEENFEEMCKFSKSMYGKKLPETNRVRTLGNSTTTQACLPEEYSNLLNSVAEDIKDIRTEEEFDNLMIEKYKEYAEAAKNNKEITKDNTKDTVISGIQMGTAALAAVFPPFIIISAILFYFKTNNNTPIAEFVNKRLENFKNGIASIGNEVKKIGDNFEKDRIDKGKKKFDEAQKVREKQRDGKKEDIEELDPNGNFKWVADIKKEDAEDIDKLTRIVFSKMNLSLENIKTLNSKINVSEPTRNY